MNDEYHGHDTEKLIEQIAIVRDTGAYNMLNTRGVQDVASEIGADELYDFIDQCNSTEYMEVLEAMGSRRSDRGGA